jgi:hypothetical protein
LLASWFVFFQTGIKSLPIRREWLKVPTLYILLILLIHIQ